MEIFAALRPGQTAEGWSKDAFLHGGREHPRRVRPQLLPPRPTAPDGTPRRHRARWRAHLKTVTKRIVEDLDNAYFPTKTIVPSTEIVHDRANLEVFRGCIRGCRFCQAGFSCRPVRKKSPESAGTVRPWRRLRGFRQPRDHPFQPVHL